MSDRITRCPDVSYRTVVADGVNVFYREAGSRQQPTLLLLHGFPSSSHMFREAIVRLAQSFHVIAPDLPGFGFTEVGTDSPYIYTFDRLAQTIDAFTQMLDLSKYTIYVFDYGAPVGFRLAMAHPDRIAAIVTQNGNAYLEGLSDGWQPIQAYWQEPSLANRNTLRNFLTAETTQWQYMQGVPDKTQIAPESYTLDALLLARSGNDEIQLDLLLDYASNVVLYPKFQAYFRDRQPPLLAVWGRNDPFFLPAGAEAFPRDLPQAEVHLLDTGHFALETHVDEITSLIIDFLDRSLLTN
jgi:pimeloyl-ACP methyl ester carboxylesterase